MHTAPQQVPVTAADARAWMQHNTLTAALQQHTCLHESFKMQHNALGAALQQHTCLRGCRTTLAAAYMVLPGSVSTQPIHLSHQCMDAA
jgi:hypothetical protein